MKEEKTIRRIKNNETGETYPLEDDNARERIDQLEEQVMELKKAVKELQSK